MRSSSTTVSRRPFSATSTRYVEATTALKNRTKVTQAVIRLSKKYLPGMAISYQHPKVKVHVGDGFKFLDDYKNEFDVIITDSSDPEGPAETLFQKPYFELLFGALKEGGVITTQGCTFSFVRVSQVVLLSNSFQFSVCFSLCGVIFSVELYNFSSKRFIGSQIIPNLANFYPQLRTNGFILR